MSNFWYRRAGWSGPLCKKCKPRHGCKHGTCSQVIKNFPKTGVIWLFRCNIPECESVWWNCSKKYTKRTKWPNVELFSLLERSGWKRLKTSPADYRFSFLYQLHSEFVWEILQRSKSPQLQPNWVDSQKTIFNVASSAGRVCLPGRLGRWASCLPQIFLLADFIYHIFHGYYANILKIYSSIREAIL